MNARKERKKTYRFCAREIFDWTFFDFINK